VETGGDPSTESESGFKSNEGDFENSLAFSEANRTCSSPLGTGIITTQEHEMKHSPQNKEP